MKSRTGAPTQNRRCTRSLPVSHRVSAAAQAGWSLIEMTAVLAVVGLLAWSGAAALDQAEISRSRAQAQQWGETLRDRLRSFALQNRRLPCPDVVGQGWEGDSSGSCTAATTGWLPYRTLGMDLPAPGLRAAYAVFRSPNTGDETEDADLALKLERTGDAPGSPTYQDPQDFIRALNNAATLAAAAPTGVLTTQPYTTGDEGPLGAVACSTNPRDNFAFRLIFPLADRDGDSTPFDSPNSPTALCSTAPSTPQRHNRDDVVLTEGFASLAGWVMARTW